MISLKKPELECSDKDCPFHGELAVRGRIPAHSTPCIPVKVGDVVRIAECRPLSKTKSFVVVEMIKEA